MMKGTRPIPMRKVLVRSLTSALVALTLAPASAAAYENLGRLFFTPQQRQDLDRRRQANAQESAATAESQITVNGRVSRSSGKTTTWINGVPQDDTQKSRDPAQVTLPGGEGEPSVKLRVGQTLDKIRGEVKDPVEGGKIVVPSEKRGGVP
jgi:hypothetical protein